MTFSRLHRAALWGAAAALLLVLSACTGAGPAAPTPATSAPGAGGGTGGLVARAATVDLGRVPFDKQVEARFELTNTSGKPIRLAAQPQVKMLEGC